MAEPLLVKKLFINVKLDKGLKKKDAMRDFLFKKVSEGSIAVKVDIEPLTEHEIDAIAVGFSKYVSMMEGRRHETEC